LSGLRIKYEFPYHEFDPLLIPEDMDVTVLAPKSNIGPSITDNEQIRLGLNEPIGAPLLSDSLQAGSRVLILVDDNTRITPTHLILPLVIDQLFTAGIAQADIKLLVASGTHRPMTEAEKERKYGAAIVRDFPVIDHNWRDRDQLTQLPTTCQGTEIYVNKLVLEADFVLGIGHIVPHRVAGFSGGCKIVQPGIGGPITTGQTHWLSAGFEGREIIGKLDNPIRREIDAVGLRAGLKYIVNTVHDGSGKIFKCVCGDPVKAFQEGARAAREIYGAPLESQGDIVITDSYPNDTELWQAAKGIFAGDLALKPGGILIVVSPCSEGVSTEHPQIVALGYRGFTEVQSLVAAEELKELTLAAHLAHIGRIARDKGTVILVSRGINRETAEQIGFGWANSPQDAFDRALQLKGKGAKVVLLRNGGEIMPFPAAALTGGGN
jgi:nickel-dependent lactate racemase